MSNPALPAGVRAITLVTAEGDIVELSREKDPDIFGGSVLALGSLGVMSHLVLDMVPSTRGARSSTWTCRPNG